MPPGAPTDLAPGGLTPAGGIRTTPSGFPVTGPYGSGVIPASGSAPVAPPESPMTPPTASAPPPGAAALPDLVPPGEGGPLPPPSDEYPAPRVLPATGLPDLVPPLPYGGTGEREVPGNLAPFIPPHRGWYTTGEFLLLRARNTDFDYAIHARDNTLGTVGAINSMKYGLGGGLRTELGYHLDQGRWDAAFAYTYFGADGNNSQLAGPGEILYPTLTRPGLTDRATSAAAHTNLNYQLFDLLVARRTALDDHFAVRWIGGFRFTDIRQTFNVSYDGADARGDYVRTRSRFQGFGPIIGAEAILIGWRGFHIYAQGTAGLISGLSSNRLTETNDNGQTTYVDTTYNVRKVVPMGSIAIGGGWQYRTLSIRAGYQITTWQGIFERPHFVDDVAQGAIITKSSNLTLEGLFVQVGLNF